jgi:DNA-binding HxlR family transcriptional regulator
LTVAQVRERGAPEQRPGAPTLSLLAVPINAAVLQALNAGPRSLFDLRREIDSPPQTTMRAYLRALVRTGVIERRRQNDFPGNVEYELAECGRELASVADVVASWLDAFPGPAPIALGSGAAKSAIKALVEGWSTGMIWAIASDPLSLTELDSVIASVSYPSLERRLGAMRHEGLVEALPTQGRGTPYGVTDWMRRAVAPLVAAARWERRRVSEETARIGERDAQAALQLALPLLRLATAASGSCRLAVQVEDDGKAALAGVVASIRGGVAEACDMRLESAADSWAVGSPEAWFAGVIAGEPGDLAFGGRPKLARETVLGLHRALFGAKRRT